MNNWTLSVQNKKVFLSPIDFTLAFDSVTHINLCNRLYNYGIQGDLLHSLTQFFSGRTHQTRVGLCLSDVAVLMSGVVQGSGVVLMSGVVQGSVAVLMSVVVLMSGVGPVLFLIFIDDLAKVLQRYGITARLFADDEKFM